MAQPVVGDTRSGVLEEIVVTARKREENLQDAPVAVSAFSAKTLERNRLVRIDDLQQTVPTLLVTKTPGWIGAANVSLRGISTSDTNATNEYPVALYLDGVYIARTTGSLFSLNDLERVEVLRGPQGTLSGRNATAGSIALYTKPPAEEFGVQQKLSYGTYNDIMSRTTVDLGRLGDTGLTARVAFMHNQVDGYVHNALTSDSNSPGAVRANAVAVAIRGDWGRLIADYKFDYDDEKGQGGNTQVIAATPTFVTFFQNYNPGFTLQPKFLENIEEKVVGYAAQTVQGQSLTIRYDVNDKIEIKSITGYRELHNIYTQISGTYPQLRGNASATGAPPFTIQDVALSLIPRVAVNQHQWSQEFQLTGKVERFSYVGGLYYFSERADQSYGKTGSLSVTVLSPTSARFAPPALLDFVNYSKSKAVYGQMSYTPPVLDDKLELTVGGRWTRDRKRLIQTNPTPGSNLIPIPRDVSRSFSNFSAEGSVRYQWKPDVISYFRVAQAYRAGGISARDTTFAPNGYAPEKEISYELGMKAELFDHRVRFNGDVYLTQYNDLQITTSFTAALGCQSSALCSTVINAASADYKGVEGELTVIPVRGLELSGTIGYIKPHYNSFRINLSATGDIARDPSLRYANLSKLTSSASATYRFEPMSFGDLSVRVNWNYHSKRYFNSQTTATNFNEEFADPGFHNIGAQITLANVRQPIFKESLTVQVYGSNLLDKHQFLQGASLGSFATVGYGPGRTFGVSLIGKF
jgi:iron complex outermembrane receptor protein